jgi:hypothetical protein
LVNWLIGLIGLIGLIAGCRLLQKEKAAQMSGFFVVYQLAVD